MVCSKHHHLRYPETPFLGRAVQRYACLGRHPRTHSIFSGMVRFKHHPPGIQKHLFWPVVCKGMRVWGATAEPITYFLALCVSNTTLPGIQKHLFWPVVWKGMGVWGATPEPTQFFWALCTSNITIQGIQKRFCWTVGYRVMGVWGATSELTPYVLAWCVSNTTILGIQKHLFWPMVCRGMRVWGRQPRTHTMGYLGCWCLKCTMPKNIVWVLGWRPKHPHLCTP